MTRTTSTMRRLLMAPALPLALLLIPLTAAGVARAAGPAAIDLTFEVGQRKGAVMVALYDSEAGYRGEKPAQVAMVPVSAGPVIAHFKAAAPGRYAVKAFHDVDGDGKMATNLMGIPTEPFAFSNNAPPRFGPAAWSDAAFDLGPTGAAQTLVIR